ncbi:1-phosphatidylinositol-3-phosphate 5-kinase FAB1B-like isoform X2 [Magnolia sinica]|uniref:1-phosphatidylinositol-3-phosphate 5-kinase FAB1B-like isoform X2 n=1 Tax=Magnolia sinica TaxID=86752 RepID=UPI00265A2237|nr:1-phosphatidylinositol-3-phosphate 5-kinase FAB1B-like isoform X2 [Magnolia sinica]
MGTPNKSISKFVDTVKSWFPCRTEPSNVSRDFWMPDHSCRVCYECDSQFTIFNRRHHCRLCGRIFCAKCTANSIPTRCGDLKRSWEEWERVRVCNFCFKQWEQEIAAVNNASGLSVLPSVTSLASPKSAGANSTNNVGSSKSYLTVPYQRMQCSSDLSPSQAPRIEPCPDKQHMLRSGMSIDSVTEKGSSSSNQYRFCMNRSDDEDDEYSVYHLDAETRGFQQSENYYGPVEFDNIDHAYISHTVHSDEGNITVNDSSSPRLESTDSQASMPVEKLEEEEEGHDNSEECDAASSIYGAESTDAEPVDFENNGLLWLPPEPEDEEDEREAVLCDDDDDEYSMGEWKNLRSSSSFGSGEYRSRDRSGEEQTKALKDVVGGHFRALVAQLLQVENLLGCEEDDEESWLDIITSLSWGAATLLKPDMSKGGGMDPGGYVKVKCIACGHRSESKVVKGVVCKKNVAHRRMKSKMKGPRFLILGGALEYQRVTNLLSSFDTLLQQEMDHLKMAVAKIDAHQPDVLLVEKSVSRHAQEYLLAKDISLVLNIKRPLLERIARCTGAQIVPSIDHLSSQKLGNCETLHVEKFFEEHGSAGQGGKKLLKTLMFFEGCPKPLGCTVLLKGANGDELKKVKHVIQYGVFAAYHLALETSFLADEGATLPELPLKSPITVALPDKPSSVDRSISTVPGFPLPTAGKMQPNGDVERPDGVLTSDLSLPSANQSINKVEVNVMPSASKGSNSQMTENGNHVHLAEPLSPGPLSPLFLSGQSISRPYHEYSQFYAFEYKNEVHFGEPYEVKDFATNSQAISGYCNFSTNGSMVQDSSEGIGAANDTDIDERKMVGSQLGLLDLSSLHQDNNRYEDQASVKEEFPPSPSDHQSILVSLSTRCVWKGTVCERAHLFRIKYYGSFDMPLGRFLRDQLFDLTFQCHSCEMPTEAHVHCYTHRQGSLTISVKKLPEIFLPGERDGKIWMWHRCLQCPRTHGFPPATRRIVMSDAAWGLSFGKFLELSFSNHAAASRVASCGHSLHRDCLRFYGFGKMVACFRYASIEIYSVYLPPSKLEFDFQRQEWIQKAANEVANKAELLFAELSNALRQIAEKRSGTGFLNSDVKVSESRHAISEVEVMLQKAKAAFEESLEKTLNKEVTMGQPILDILEINRLRRQLLLQSSAGDHCLILTAGMDSGLHEETSSSIGKQEKPGSIEKPVEMNLACKPNRSLTSSEFLLPDPSSNRTHLTDNCRRLSEQDHNHGQGMLGCHSTSLSNRNQLTESGDVFRRTLSEGQFPIMADLSDKLDAAWTGENHAGSTTPRENGSAVPNLPMIDSAEAVVAMSELGEHSCDGDDRGEVKLAQSRMSMPVKRADPVDDITSWISKNSGGSAPRFNSHVEYNPVYLFSLRELDQQCGVRLRFPVGVNGTVVPVYDDEPTSIISYALASFDYHIQISDERARLKDSGDSSISLPLYDPGSCHSFQSFDETSSESFRSLGSIEDSLLLISGSRSSLVSDPLFHTNGMPVRVSFADELGKMKYSVTCYYAKHFDALRRTCCPCELDFVRSLSRCKKWGAQGGKSNVFFAKTLDDRFIIKQVTKTELESFIKFAPEYFKYLSESIGTRSPTCLAKILGIYQVTSKQLKGGKESKMDVLVMENLLFRRNVSRLYDLKGSSRSRYNPDSSGANKVLLDQNLIEAMPTSPIFVGNKAKRLLERAVWNDTSFLAEPQILVLSSCSTLLNNIFKKPGCLKEIKNLEMLRQAERYKIK